ncbi:hypothetical protein J4729_07540 [Leisingera sp. HS039]|uniref:hypothetical protein n=1 Tax=Leisingera sp. HS039 TaxID=2818496 RepID=UPI001B3A2299|nr:hypothetical protein [Leisingera sp. HS039]MBQ4824402.1 hypothetical protein [Leisingera sp. HS039]
MTAARWCGPYYFIGRLKVGQISPNWTPGPNGETFAGLCSLPGAAQVLGPFGSEQRAREMVEKSAASRIKAMFGAGPETTAAAVSEGRNLRVTARAILMAGVWSCDKPVNVYAMFDDLRHALGMKREDVPAIPKPKARAAADEYAPLPPEDFEPFEEDGRQTA